VSFASADGGDPSGVDATKDFPATPGLQVMDADRTSAETATDSILGRTGGFTNIGAGLRKAHDVLLEAGRTITINSSIFLVTDGINNRPLLDPQGNLDHALQTLVDDGVHVLISCVGEARINPLCSRIADRVAGHFVDSATTANLYDAFVEFVAKAERNGIARTQ